MVSDPVTVDNYVSSAIANYQDDPEFVANGWAIGTAEEVLRRLETRGEPQVWLATKLGVSRARVSYLLSAQPNMTYLTVAKLAVAIGGISQIVLSVNGDVEFRSEAETAPYQPSPSASEDRVISAMSGGIDAQNTTPGLVFNNASA